MKTPKQWISELSDLGFGHQPDCICDRCVKGKEVFLLESDIKRIQINARCNGRHTAIVNGFDRSNKTIILKFEELPANVVIGDKWKVTTN